MSLKLKDNINKNIKHTLFLSRSRGGKIKFDPSNTPVEEYVKYKMIGFDLFICSVCSQNSCYGCEQTEEERIKTEVFNYINPSNEYEKLTLKELRKLFPDIKATSKEVFIKKIKDGK